MHVKRRGPVFNLAYIAFVTVSGEIIYRLATGSSMIFSSSWLMWITTGFLAYALGLGYQFSPPLKIRDKCALIIGVILSLAGVLLWISLDRNGNLEFQRSVRAGYLLLLIFFEISIPYLLGSAEYRTALSKIWLKK